MSGTTAVVDRGAESGDEMRIPGSELLDPVAYRRRRHAVSRLRRHSGPIALADLADEVAAMENGTPLAEVPASEVERVHTTLYHSHVPKLEAAGVVEYLRGGELIELVDDARGGEWP